MLVGPTAVGKSEVALGLAGALGGEIVSLDSRQMVRGLDIGTAKPSRAERERVPHHLIDIAEPDEPLPLSRVLGLVYAAVDELRARGVAPILVGGTGQYVRALREGWQVPEVPPDPALRARLAAAAAAAGPDALHARLAEVDPASAARIDPRNVRRVARALEVHELTGRPLSELRARTGPRYDGLVLGLSRPRPALYARVDARIDAMLSAGLEAELRRLLAAGYDWRLPSLSSVGYGEWRAYFEGTIDRAEVVRLIRHNTRRLVRSQAAWFRPTDPGLMWFDLEDDGAAAALHSAAAAWLGDPARAGNEAGTPPDGVRSASSGGAGGVAEPGGDPAPEPISGYNRPHVDSSGRPEHG